MISKNKIKYIQSLHKKKYRDAEGVYIVEGNKMVEELLNEQISIRSLCATEAFFANTTFSTEYIEECIELTDVEMKKISLLKTPQHAFAIVERKVETLSLDELKGKFTIALDHLQDPGNLGTIIRTANWFGIENILCSSDTVDCFNPKVIQASMGAIFRVKIHYVDLVHSLDAINKLDINTYGTFLEGENIYKQQLSNNAVLVIGNEGNGISTEVEAVLKNKLHIPSFASQGGESLNAAISSAICCSEFCRKNVIIG